MRSLRQYPKATMCGVVAGALLLCLQTTGVFAQQPKKIVLSNYYTTAEATNQKLAPGRIRAFEEYEQPDEFYSFIMVDIDKTFQTIEGFGGAFTDTAAINFGMLTPEQKALYLRESFDPINGNGYSYCRTTIHSCDYSDEQYTYTAEGDKDLKTFSIDHDRKNRLPMIKGAIAASGNTMKLFASPWSPPGWMKTNNEMLHGGKLLPEHRQTWANYFVKYLKAYQSEGIPITCVSVQNEAMAVQTWESCVYTAAEEKDFVRDYLGPAFEKNGLKDTEILIYDHNRGIMYQRAEVAYEDPKASKYITGMAYHWYTGNHYDNVKIVHDAFPDKKLIFSEGSTSGNWGSGLNASKNIIIDLNNWANAWTFWNLMLDETGGPYHLGGRDSVNLQRGIVTYDRRNGDLIFNPSHYIFGHFSRFIRPGAKRIACTSNDDDLITTGAINPDNSVAVVVQNLVDAEKMFRLWVDGKVLSYTIPPNGLMTITF